MFWWIQGSPGRTLDMVSEFATRKKSQGGGGGEVEVVVAHDGTWREQNRHRFWPAGS